MAELTKAQIALQASVDSYRRLPGDLPTTSNILSRASEFLTWLDKQDARSR
jgi:hypothetical protein